MDSESKCDDGNGVVISSCAIVVSGCIVVQAHSDSSPLDYSSCISALEDLRRHVQVDTDEIQGVFRPPSVPTVECHFWSWNHALMLAFTPLPGVPLAEEFLQAMLQTFLYHASKYPTLELMEPLLREALIILMKYFAKPPPTLLPKKEEKVLVDKEKLDMFIEPEEVSEEEEVEEEEGEFFALKADILKEQKEEAEKAPPRPRVRGRVRGRARVRPAMAKGGRGGAVMRRAEIPMLAEEPMKMKKKKKKAKREEFIPEPLPEPIVGVPRMKAKEFAPPPPPPAAAPAPEPPIFVGGAAPGAPLQQVPRAAKPVEEERSLELASMIMDSRMVMDVDEDHLGEDLALDIEKDEEMVGAFEDYSPLAEPVPEPMPAPKKAKPKKPKLKIDNVFVDMENVFNGLSALIVSIEPARLLTWFLLFPLVIFIYSLVSGFTLLILLPACFVILLARANIVETRVEKFAQRQEYLAAASVVEKSLRFISLLLRAVPMLFVLVGWPVISIYIIIPHYEASISSVNLCIGAQLLFVLLMQIFGTFRSAISFWEGKKKNEEDAHAQLRADAEKNAKGGATENNSAGKRAQNMLDGTDGPVSSETVSALSFRWKNLGNIIAITTLTMEIFQLATFGMQTFGFEKVPNAPAWFIPKADISAEEPQFSILMNKLVPLFFFDFMNFLSFNVHYVYTLSATAVVLLLLLAFQIQFFREIRKFGFLKADGRQTEANNTFFFSFVGSLVYGHGELKNVSPAISATAAFLSDTLFMVVCEKFLLLFVCDYSDDSPPTMLLSSSVQCWEGSHKHLALIALIAFSYYLPLCSMISPMLSESDVEEEKESSTDGEEESESKAIKVKRKKKDVFFIKPFLSAITVSKCFMLIVSAFFGHGDPYYAVTAAFLACTALFIATTFWTMRPASSLPGSRLGMGEPCRPPFINVWRSLGFLIGAWGALVVLLAQTVRGSPFLAGDGQLVILVIGFLCSLIIGYFWYQHWQKQFYTDELGMNEEEVKAMLKTLLVECDLCPDNQPLCQIHGKHLSHVKNPLPSSEAQIPKSYLNVLISELQHQPHPQGHLKMREEGNGKKIFIDKRGFFCISKSIRKTSNSYN